MPAQSGPREGEKRSAERLGTWLSNIGLLLLACALALAVGEAYLRRDYAHRYRNYPKNLVTRMTTPEYDVEIATNAQGFRDRNHTLRKPKGAVRIAVVGDSFTWGSGVEAGEVFTARLESLLRERTGNPEVEVFNYGVTWTGPVYYARVFESAAARYRPDIVVVASYVGNDVADALRESRQRAPRFAMVARVRELQERARSMPAPTSFGWATQQEENPATLAALLRVGARAGIPPDTITARYNAVPESLRADALAYRVNPFNLAEAIIDPESMLGNVLLEAEEAQEAWDSTEFALQRLESAIVRRGAGMVLVAIPAAPQVGQQYWWASRLGLRFDERLLFETPVQDRMRQFASTHDVSYIDLLPSLRAETDRTLYFEQDGHWTPAGHEIAARVIAESLATRLGAEPLRSTRKS
jgi:hypothetical protein